MGDAEPLEEEEEDDEDEDDDEGAGEDEGEEAPPLGDRYGGDSRT